MHGDKEVVEETVSEPVASAEPQEAPEVVEQTVSEPVASAEPQEAPEVVHEMAQ